MNKYYLYKKVLTSKVCTEELELESAISIFGGQKLTQIEAFKERAEMIQQLIKTQFVEGLENINGNDIKSLFIQAESIRKSLLEVNYAETLILNGHKFIEVLEGLFQITLEHINNYEKAEKLLTGKRNITVILDGNNTHLIKDGKEVMLRTEIENNIVTIEKCREIVKNLNAMNCYPKELKFLLSIYTESAGNECGDYPEECLLKRDAYYYTDNDYLKIDEE